MEEIMKIENLKKAVFTSVNESGCSLPEVYYVMRDIYMEIVGLYNEQLKQLEAQSQSTEMKEEEKEGDEE